MNAQPPFRSRRVILSSGDGPRRDAAWLVRSAISSLLWLYLRVFHRFEMRYHPDLPRRGPYIAVISHTSLLDTPALIAADPFERPTAMVIKQEVTRIPIIGRVLKLWGAIPVERRGQDIASLRRIKRVLKDGGGICVAPSGTRSADGRVGPVNPVLVRLIVDSDAVVFPVAIVGTRECMPKGAKLPRPGKIYVDAGPPIDLARFRGRHLSPDEIAEAAGVIRDHLAAILPDRMKPLPSTPVLGRYVPPGD